MERFYMRTYTEVTNFEKSVFWPTLYVWLLDQLIKCTVVFRVRPIPCWRPIADTIGRSCTDTDTDTGNDVPHSLRQTYVSYVAHTIRTFQNITPLTLCFEMCETNYRLEIIGVSATVLTVETGKRTTGIGADTKISIGRYRYPPILASIGRYRYRSNPIDVWWFQRRRVVSQSMRPVRLRCLLPTDH